LPAACRRAAASGRAAVSLLRCFEGTAASASGLRAWGTAFVQLLPNKQNSVSILAVRLPEPATRGDFDAYQGIIESPGAPKVTFPFAVVPTRSFAVARNGRGVAETFFCDQGFGFGRLDSETGETGKAVSCGFFAALYLSFSRELEPGGGICRLGKLT